MNQKRFLFTPETPLGQDVQAILLKHTYGLRIDEVRRLLRREKGRHVSMENLQELLGNTRVFSLLPGDRYVLAGSERQSTLKSDNQESSVKITEVNPWANPFISNLPLARENYIVYDLETTGVDPTLDRIIQIAALKIINGDPVEMRNWYVNPGEIEIPYTLKIKLGMVDNTQIEQAILKAPFLDEILPEFLAFISNFPIVAHNARFDGRFLASALHVDFPSNPLIDNLELGILLHPNLC